MEHEEAEEGGVRCDGEGISFWVSITHIQRGQR
jgi:hypothetical protein